MTVAISVSGLVKTFGSTRALDGLDLAVETGEIAAAAGFLTVFPDDACDIPLVSNLNFLPGDTAPNLVVVRLSEAGSCASGSGRVDIYNSAGITHVIADVFGYFTSK